MNFVISKKQPPSRAQRKKNLYQLLIARSDVSAAQSACKLFLSSVKDMGDELYYPLFAAIVVCYVRPFTNNDPFGPLPQKWSKFADGKHQATHNKLVEARHEQIAHSDMTVRKAMIVPPGVLIGKWKGKELKSNSIGVQTSFYLFPVAFFQNVWNTAADLNKRLSDEIDAQVEQLYGGMELPTGAFRIRIDAGL